MTRTYSVIAACAGLLLTMSLPVEPEVRSDTSGRPSQEIGRSYNLRVWHSLRGHMHNKAVHVPIGLGIAAFVLMIYRRGKTDSALLPLVLLAALGAVIAYVTGVQQSAAYEGGTKEWIIEIHQTLGLATGILLWVWVATLWIRPLQRWSVHAGSLVMICLLITGFYGGVIAHG